MFVYRNSNENLDFDQNRKLKFGADIGKIQIFVKKIKLLPKIEISVQYRNFGQKSTFLQKIELSTKTSILDGNFDFWHRFYVLTEIWILPKTSIFARNFDFDRIYIFV